MIAVKVDGVLECGDPEGPIKIAWLISLSTVEKVVIVDDNYRKVWSRADLGGHMLPAYILGESLRDRLRNIRRFFKEERYIFIGPESDRADAEAEGFTYIPPEKFMEVVP
ncbi:MAG: hypothetical protein QXL22_01025 [Candidatus Nezhaarchaeales archaeon]